MNLLFQNKPSTQPQDHFLIQHPFLEQIEVKTTYPKEPKKDICALVCHPHPLYGGNIDHKVITTLVRTFHQFNIPTIRFQFRGVGLSKGEHDHGIGEQEDCEFMIQWLKQKYPSIILSGFSFGGKIAALSSFDQAITNLILLSPALNIQNHPIQINKPALLVHSMDDDIVPYALVKEWFLSQNNSHIEFKSLHNIHHFYHGYLTDLKNIILSYLSSP